MLIDMVTNKAPRGLKIVCATLAAYFPGSLNFS